MSAQRQYLSAAETAKLVRKALKADFPGVKFSVRSSTYAGGASISVRWIDGPTSKTVDRTLGLRSLSAQPQGSAQPMSELWICGCILEFRDEGGPETQVLHVGTREDCERVADLVPAVSYSGGRPVKAATLVVQRHPAR